MDPREIAERARCLAVMVRVQGPDPQGLKMRGHAFHRRENGNTTVSASGFLLPPSLSDSLSLLNGKQKTGALVVTTASILVPFLPAQDRNSGYRDYNVDQARLASVPELIPGACIDVLREQNRPEMGLNEPKVSLGWTKARLIALVDVAKSSAALQLLIGSHTAPTDHGTWNVGWKLTQLNNSNFRHAFLQREFKGAGDTSKSNVQLGFALDESTSLHQMAMPTAKIAFLEIPSLDPKDLISVRVSQQGKRGDFLLVMGSPFGALSPLHFINSVSVGAVANTCPPGSHDISLLLADIHCLPGMEGGPVFDSESCLLGFLTVPLGRRNCSAEIQIVITWDAISIACNPLLVHEENGSGDKKLEKAMASSTACLFKPFPEKAMASIVLVKMGDEAWASGILLNKHGLILTNAHLLEPWRYGRSLHSSNEKMRFSVSENDTIHTVEDQTNPTEPGYRSFRKLSVRLNHTKPWIWSDAKVVYVSQGPLDVALLQLDFVPHQLCAIHPEFLCPSEGLKVHVIGHGPFGPRSDIGPYVSSGVVTKVIMSLSPSSSHQQGGLGFSDDCSPVMLQTTAAVYPGMSGGAVINSDGRMIGLVTSNSRHAGGSTIPHLNFSLPCAALKPIFDFAEHPDRSILEILDRPSAALSSIWALVPPPPPSLRSQPQLDGKNQEGKGSRFAKFLAERHNEVELPNDRKPLLKGKISSNL